MKMFFKRQIKKSLAFAAALTLLSAVIPADLSVSYADEADTKPYIYVDYLGLAERTGNDSRGPSDTKVETRPAFKTADKGKVFWVGVRVTNLELTFMQSKGITSMDIAFDYNSDYMIPADEIILSADDALAKGTAPVDAEKWKQVIEKFNFTEENVEDSNSKTLWDSRYYYIEYGDPEANIDNDTQGKAHQSEVLNGSAWKTAHITINKNMDEFANQYTNRFYSIENGSGYYLIRMPFILLDAPADGTQPKAFFLSRGPKTLAMEAGGDDDDMPYSWEDDGDRRPDVNPVRNLKNYFSFGGDLNLFQEADSITNMRFTYPETADENATPVAVTLYKNFEQNDSETIYNPETFVYYISVPKDTKYVDFITDGTENAPYVEHGDYTSPAAFTSVSGITKGADGWHGRVELNGTNAASGQENTPEIAGAPNDPAYKNVIRFTAGEKTYTVHVREVSDTPSGEARIELAPGNSPYGLIERMGTKWYNGDGEAWSEEKIAAAKTAFDEENMFTTEYLPDNQIAGEIFSPRAWIGFDISDRQDDIENPEINLDRNVSVQFIYSATSFYDAGFEAYYSDGTKVNDNDVKRTITFAVMTDAGYLNIADAVNTSYEITGNSSDEVDLFSDVYICPGIYDMEYSFKDLDGNLISTNRKFVVLWELGNADLDTLLTAGDASAINNTLENRIRPYENLDESGQNLYIYRIMDADRDAILSAGDASRINNTLENRTKINAFYSTL